MAEEKTVKTVEVDLLVDSLVVDGEFVFKKTTPTITVPEWLANSMVIQKVAKIKGTK